MKNISYILLLKLIIFLSISFVACESEIETLTIEDGYEYFPMESGHWVEYQVDSTIYSSFLEGGQRSVSVRVREVLGETFLDNEGREAVTLERYVKYDENESWSAIKPIVWYQVRTEQQAERMEGERRFMNLTFPMLESRQWFGNTYLNTENNSELATFDSWQYTYQNIASPQTINGLNFSETVTILQNDYENLIEKIYSKEVYAKGIGLVEKEQWLLKTNDSTIPEPWPERSNTGFLTNIKVVDYKK